MSSWHGWVRRVLRQRPPGDRFTGDFPSFQAALGACADPSGYLAESAVARARRRTRRIGDSVRADPAGCGAATAHVVAALVHPLARCERGPLRVLDFGGSLGWSYYRVRNVLPDSQALAWDVVETPAMVEAAREECAEADLHFFTDLAQVQGRTYDVVLASGSLQYIDSPSSCFDRLCAVAAPFMILDLLPFSDAERDRLAVQSPPGEDRFLYPAWVFSHSLWTARFAAAGWRVRLRWPHRDACLFLDGKRHEYQGLLLERPPARDRT